MSRPRVSDGRAGHEPSTERGQGPIRVLEIGLAAGEIGGAAGATVALHETVAPVTSARLVVARATDPFTALGPAVRGSHVGFVLNTAIDHGLRFLTKPATPFVWGRGTAFPRDLRRAVEDCDLVQVYWTDRLLGVKGLASLAERGKPLVLVPMDFEPLTGGCHYPLNGCEGYLADCEACPVSGHMLLRRTAVRHRKAKASVLGSDSVFVVAGNEWYRERVVAAGCDPVRTKVIYTPVAPCYHEAGTRRSEGTTLATDRPERVLAIGATDLSAPRKRIAESIEIARIVAESDASVRLVIVGRNCPDLPPSLRDRTTQVGMVSEARLADILAGTDVFLSTASEDGGPMMLAAAWSAGAGVAATPIGYASDLLTDGLSGRFLLGEPQDQADAVSLLLAQRSADPVGSVEASRSLGDRFSHEQAMMSYLELYEALLKR